LTDERLSALTFLSCISGLLGNISIIGLVTLLTHVRLQNASVELAAITFMAAEISE